MWTCDIQVYFRIFRHFSEINVEIKVIEFVNLKFNVREWQIICDELESLNVKLLPQACFLKKLTLYNALELWNTTVFPSILEIIVEIQVFSGLHQSLNLSISD